MKDFPCPATKCLCACGYPLARQKMYRHLSEHHDWSQQEASAHAEAIPPIQIDERDAFIAEIAGMEEDAWPLTPRAAKFNDLIRRARELRPKGGD